MCVLRKQDGVLYDFWEMGIKMITMKCMHKKFMNSFFIIENYTYIVPNAVFAPKPHNALPFLVNSIKSNGTNDVHF